MNAENPDLTVPSGPAAGKGQGVAGSHQTVSRVTRILEEVGYRIVEALRPEVMGALGVDELGVDPYPIAADRR